MTPSQTLERWGPSIQPGGPTVCRVAAAQSQILAFLAPWRLRPHLPGSDFSQ